MCCVTVIGIVFCFVASLITITKSFIYTMLVALKGIFTASFALGYNIADISYTQIIWKSAVIVMLGLISL